MSTLIGREGEIIVNLSNFSVHVHDGITEGGFALALADASNMQEATIGQDGKMTAIFVSELSNATVNIANNTAAIAIGGAAIGVNSSDIAALQSGKADKATPSAANNVATLSAGGNLQDSGLLVTDVGLPTGTIATFNQSTAPTGWTKLVVDNNKAFRLVTGTVSSGGSDNFTTVFVGSKSTQSHALTISQMPSHNHQVDPFANDAFAGGAAGGYRRDIGGSILTDNTGGGSGHSHDINNFNLAFVDMILAQKD